MTYFTQAVSQMGVMLMIKMKKTNLLKDVVYGSYTQLQFQTRWDNLISELDYQDNAWFKSIFDLRDK
jgi:hypothetical protein